MRLVGTKSLQPGDILAMPVCTSGGKSILNAGVTLTESFIDRLKQFKIHKVYINDGRFEDIEVYENLDFRIRNNAFQVIMDTHERLHKQKPLDEYVLKDIAKDIVEYVRQNKDRGVSVLSTDVIDDYIAEHSINVALLTAYMGNKMDFNFTQLCDLTVGALIHDIGRENTSEEKTEHVQTGFEAMRKCRGFSLHSSIVCYEHHENFDGSGYPRKIKGNAISEFTRVIRTADVFDNILQGLTNNGVSVMPHQAYEYVLAVSGEILDPEMVERFRDTIVFFPSGCTVLLSNGLKGVVVRQNLGSPQRPVVRVFNDTTVIGEVDLLKSLTLFIKDVIII